MKSLRTELILIIGAIVLAVCLLLGGAATIVAGNAIRDTAIQQLENKAGDAAKIIGTIVGYELEVLQQVAQTARISDPASTMDKRIEAMSQAQTRNGYVRVFFIAPDGNATYNDGSERDLGTREYFQKALKGENNVSDTITSTTDGSTVVAYAVPVMFDGKVVAVLGATRDAAYLSDAISDVNIGGESYTFVSSSLGVLQAHRNLDLVKTQYNLFEETKKDPRLEDLKVLFESMIARENGYGEYWFQEEEKVLGFHPIDGTTWAAAVTMPRSQMLEGRNATMTAVAVAALLMMLIGVGLSVYIGGRIAKPIQEASRHALVLAGGDLSQPVPAGSLKKKNEIGQLGRAMQTMTENFRNLVGAITSLAEQVAASSEELTATADNVQHTSSEIGRTIGDIAAGATDQAQSTEIGVRSTNEMGDIIDQSVHLLADVGEASNLMGKRVTAGLSVVENLRMTAESAAKGTTLIREVTNKTNQSVSRIGEASSLITAIAEQTNLLALNAAIEAARAGEQGRGFAVVAEEIRKLAEQSAGATRTIDEMVRELTGHSDVSVKTSEQVGQTVNAQMNSVRETDETYRSISEAVQKSVGGIAEVSEQTSILNERKNRIMDVMQSLLAVAQENAASTEEVSSSVHMQNSAIMEMSEASRQLAVMAQELTEQTGRFRL